jgi:heme-degrading monooxygenase HmoA
VTAISRHWRAIAKPDQVDRYLEHLTSQTFPALQRIAGFTSAVVLRRDIAEGTELVVITEWTSMTAIEEFAGPDPELAVVPEVVTQMMVEYDARVRHYAAMFHISPSQFVHS